MGITLFLRKSKLIYRNTVMIESWVEQNIPSIHYSMFK